MSSDNQKNGDSRCAGYVLSGGQSRRFGTNKALANLGGELMLARMVRLISGTTEFVKIVSSGDENYNDVGVPLLQDCWPGEGPLGGIVTALRASRDAPNSRADWNLIVSCDMPLLTSEFLRFLVAHATASAAQAVAPRSSHGIEPLCACWRTDTVDVLRSAFEGGMRRVNDGLQLLRTEVLDEDAWRRFDSDGRLFWNMNTREDYEEARRIVEAGTP